MIRMRLTESDRYGEAFGRSSETSSMHAAGVVIGQKPLMNLCLFRGSRRNIITTQFTMTTLEELGLLKMDFLGLRTLTVIQNAQSSCKKKAAELNIIRSITMIKRCWIISEQVRQMVCSSLKVPE